MNNTSLESREEDILREMYGPETDKTTKEQRKLHYEQFHNFLTSWSRHGEK
jgi:hypothetical protein